MISPSYSSMGDRYLLSLHTLVLSVTLFYSPHGSGATPDYFSPRSTLDYTPTTLEDYETWYSGSTWWLVLHPVLWPSAIMWPCTFEISQLLANHDAFLPAYALVTWSYCSWVAWLVTWWLSDLTAFFVLSFSPMSRHHLKIKKINMHFRKLM